MKDMRSASGKGSTRLRSGGIIEERLTLFPLPLGEGLGGELQLITVECHSRTLEV